MTLEDLIIKFPWADHPLIRTYAEDFTEKQWQMLADADLGKLVNEDKLFDESLFVFLERIKSELIYKQHTFENKINSYLNIALITSDLAVKKRRLPFCSAIHCLLKFRFSKYLLDDFLSMVRSNAGLEYIFNTAAVLCESNLTNINKKHVLSQEWKDELCFFKHIVAPHTLDPTPKEIFAKLIELTYEKFQADIKPNSFVYPCVKARNKLALFEDELAIFKNEIIILWQFYSYSMHFLDQWKTVNTNESKQSSLQKSSNYLVLICGLHIEFNQNNESHIMTITYEDCSFDKLYVSELNKNAIIECDNLQDLLKHFPRDREHIYNKVKEYADSFESTYLLKVS